MAKLGKEVRNKKHNIRRAFIIGTAVVGALALGVGVFAGVSASPIVIAMECALLGVGAGLAVGTAIVINKSHESLSVASNTKTAEKTLEEIKQLDKDLTSTHSREYRAKIIRKYANANLSLARVFGSSKFGVFRSNTGISDDDKAQQAAGLSAEIDALSLLRDIEPTENGKAKYSTKIQLANQKLTKLIEEEGVKMPPYKWTQTYSDVLPDVRVLDRRNEIACLTESTKTAYAGLIEESVVTANSKILDVIVRFNGASGLAPTFARAEDETQAEQIKSLLLKDVYDSLAGKSAEQIRAMFPLTIESKIVDKRTTQVLEFNADSYRSYSQLVSKFDSSKEA